jgi:CheY-like chemotaxis protein
VVEVSAEPAKIIVLVVDDEEQVRKLTCRILQRAGYGVLSARSGQEALTISRTDGIIHLMLSDVEMDGMNGIELGRKVKVERPDIQVLLYSANFSHAANSEFPFLAKPFLPKDLVSFVANALASRPAPAAAPPLVTEPSAEAGRVLLERVPRRWRQTFTPSLVAAGLVLCLIPLGLYKIIASRAESADTVNLQTWRDRGGSAVARAGRSLILKLNLTGIPRHDSYRIDLVDLNGQVIWQQVIPAPRTEVLQARSAALRSGIFFVRAYAAPEGLLREYELDIGENQ